MRQNLIVKVNCKSVVIMSRLRWPAGIYRAKSCLFESRFFRAKRQAVS